MILRQKRDEKMRETRKMRQMTTILIILITLGIATTVQAQNYGAGSCHFPNTKMFPTIQAAVNATSPGSTVAVCPGIYPEQVTITKPLTLLGRAFGNASRAIVTVPPGAQSPNVANDPSSWPTFAQVLVRNANSPGPVNIKGITVDGAGATDVNGLPLCTTGIFYDSGTSGTVNEVTTRNQMGDILNQPGGPESGCGYGIWAENQLGPVQTVTIENSSVHDFGYAGISADTRDDNPTLNATIFANFVTGAPALSGIASDANSSITNNFVVGTGGGGEGINLQPQTGFSPGNTARISGNTVADVTFSTAIDSAGHSTIQSNRVSNAMFGVAGSDDDSLLSDIVVNTSYAIALNCVGLNSNISQNIINDSRIAFLNAPVTTAGNQLDNVDTVSDSSECN